MPEVASPLAAGAANALRDAGHVVHTCHEPDERGFACAALRGRTCPIETAPIDVVVGIRSAADPQPRRSEDALLCGARHRIPVVVAGRTDPNPFSRWTTITARAEDVVAAVAAAADEPLPDQTAAAAAGLAEAFEIDNLPADSGTVVVHRRDARLRVELRLDPSIPDRQATAAAVRVEQAVRALDPWAAAVEVLVARA